MIQRSLLNAWTCITLYWPPLMLHFTERNYNTEPIQWKSSIRAAYDLSDMDLKDITLVWYTCIIQGNEITRLGLFTNQTQNHLVWPKYKPPTFTSRNNLQMVWCDRFCQWIPGYTLELHSVHRSEVSETVSWVRRLTVCMFVRYS